MFKGSEELIAAAYPECLAAFQGEKGKVAVVAASINGSTPEVAAAYDLTYGTAHWIALALHTLAIEIYVSWARGDHHTDN